MFVYVDKKLYTKHGDKLVGVSVTPTGIVPSKCTIDYVCGQPLTLDEVYAKFGILFGESYLFPDEESKVGVPNEPINVDEKPVKPRGRKSK